MKNCVFCVLLLLAAVSVKAGTILYTLDENTYAILEAVSDPGRMMNGYDYAPAGYVPLAEPSLDYALYLSQESNVLGFFELSVPGFDGTPAQVRFEVFRSGCDNWYANPCDPYMGGVQQLGAVVFVDDTSEIVDTISIRVIAAPEPSYVMLVGILLAICIGNKFVPSSFSDS